MPHRDGCAAMSARKRAAATAASSSVYLMARTSSTNSCSRSPRRQGALMMREARTLAVNTMPSANRCTPLGGRVTKRTGSPLAVLTWPVAAPAQQAGRTYRLGAILPLTRDAPVNVAFLDEREILNPLLPPESGPKGGCNLFRQKFLLPKSVTISCFLQFRIMVRTHVI